MSVRIVYDPDTDCVVVNGIRDAQLGFNMNRDTRERCRRFLYAALEMPEPRRAFVEAFLGKYDPSRRSMRRLSVIAVGETVCIRQGIGCWTLTRRDEDTYVVVHVSGAGRVYTRFTGHLNELREWLANIAVTPDVQRTVAEAAYDCTYDRLIRPWQK